MSGFRLGVDFGTSHTVAVLCWPDGRRGPVLFDGSPLLPSAVFADPAGRLLAGRDAVHAARAHPECYEPHPKRRIDDGTVLLGRAEIPVEELITAVLRRVATEASRVAGAPITRTVVTYPAGWAQPRRHTLHTAATAAFGPVDLLAEPVAAAGHFVHTAGSQIPVGGHAAVYDLGAGTFDASVVTRTSDGFQVLTTGGLDDAGGLDIDAAILAHLAAGRDPATWQRLAAPATAADRRASRLLWDDVRTGKEMLSRAPATTVHIPLFDDDAPLGREQLDQLAGPILHRTVTTTGAVIAAAGIEPARLAGLFLVGGASRTPLAATLLHQHLGIAPTVIDQPELAVADGALHPHRPPPPAPPPAHPPATAIPPASRRRTRAALLAAAITGIILAAVAGTALALASGDRPEASSTTNPPTTPSTSPTPSPTVSSVADPCLLGTWTLSSSYRTWTIDGDRVPMSTDSGEVVRYLRPDGTSLVEYHDWLEVGSLAGRDYQVTTNGHITFNYRTSGDSMLWSNQQFAGEVVIRIDGRETHRFELTAITEPGRFDCADRTFILYTEDSSTEFTRTSADWDK